jgi:hypothetical protein
MKKFHKCEQCEQIINPDKFEEVRKEIDKIFALQLSKYELKEKIKTYIHEKYIIKDEA